MVENSRMECERDQKGKSDAVALARTHCDPATLVIPCRFCRWLLQTEVYPARCVCFISALPAPLWDLYQGAGGPRTWFLHSDPMERTEWNTYCLSDSVSEPRVLSLPLCSGEPSAEAQVQQCREISWHLVMKNAKSHSKGWVHDSNMPRLRKWSNGVLYLSTHVALATIAATYKRHCSAPLTPSQMGFSKYLFLKAIFHVCLR